MAGAAVLSGNEHESSLEAMASATHRSLVLSELSAAVTRALLVAENGWVSLSRKIQLP